MVQALMGLSAFEEGRVLAARGDLDPAIQRLSEALNDEFFHDEALFMLGGMLLAKGLNGLGAVLTSAAVDARAAKGRAFPEALMNLGAAYKAERNNDMAKRVWEDALRHETVPSERAKLLVNLSGLYVNEGQPAKAIPYCDAALKEDPNNHGAHANRGMACLELARWQEGWDGWLHTYATGDRNKRTYPNIPEWDGSEGKKLIVWGDQGLGDELFYASCLADLARISRRIILDCHPRLDKLFQRSFPEFEVHGTRKTLTALDWLPGCDAEASVCLSDLPAYFRKNGEWDGKPYLKASVSPAPKVPARRIGLSWAGGTKKTRTDLRSVVLTDLEPILRAAPEAEFFSLQYTPNAAREVCEFEEKTGLRIQHYPGQVECTDYDKTASFVASLDLVITMPTSVQHLAGSLGVPLWTMVPHRASWRWGGVTGKDSLPWYGSARLFRQDKDGDWGGVIERIAGELRAHH
jgi:tetratricopeptide (TPR) repeat protein